MKEERKKFENIIQYRQFLERNKDGSYKLEWVEGRWQGWMMKCKDIASYESVKDK